VRVPPPDSAAVLSTEGSCALSPVSVADDAAYAEWWSPNGSWADGLAGAGGGSRSSSASGLAGLGSGEVLRSESDEQLLLRRAGSRGQMGGSSEGGAAVTSPTGAQSEAALKIEQELAAAMAAPVASSLLTSRRSGNGTGSSSGGGRSSSSGSSSGPTGQQQQQQKGLQRSSSAGWEAAVARARNARSPRHTEATSVVLGLGVMGSHYHPAGAGLHRRSRSPDATSATQLPGTVVAGAGGLRTSRPGHRHKRSSSLNDLPELQALFDAGDLPHPINR
jgi:hypothetical protein